LKAHSLGSSHLGQLLKANGQQPSAWHLKN
jgi:hypothetical protein